MLTWDSNLAAYSSLDGGLCRQHLDAAGPECLCDAISVYPLTRSPTQHLAK